MIETVKIQGQGYLLNGTMHVPGNAPGNSEYELIKQWIAEGNIPEPEFTEEEILEVQKLKTETELSTAKETALANIKVSVSGSEFDGRAKDQVNIMAAIQAAEILEENSTEWKLADNSLRETTVDELKMVLALSIQEVGRIVKVTNIEDL